MRRRSQAQIGILRKFYINPIPQEAERKKYPELPTPPPPKLPTRGNEAQLGTPVLLAIGQGTPHPHPGEMEKISRHLQVKAAPDGCGQFSEEGTAVNC